jgi:hypothetical protein
MIRPFHLEDFVARFHENGNAQSFSACAFTYKGQNLQAVMFGNREFMTHGYLACARLRHTQGTHSRPVRRNSR